MDIFDWDHSDFYVKVEINGVWGESPKLGLYQYGHKFPNYEFTVNVPDDFPLVPVRIEVWDQDVFWDSQVDICRVGRTVIVVYNLKNGKWTGHDHSGDRNGFGHSSGYEDYIWNDGNADIWFDIYQNDYDSDRLPFYREVNYLGTNPVSADWDSDGDTMPDWWEERYGFDRLNPSDAHADPDSDTLVNKAEYEEGTDPLFFEVNLMVALNWSADSAYLGDLAVGLKRASDFLFDSTDGHLYFRRLFIYNYAYNTTWWSNAHIQI
jgi:hypothetical protein